MVTFFFALTTIALCLWALRDEFRPGGLRRNHYLHCDRVQFVIETRVAAFSRELAEWDGSLEEIWSRR